MLFNYFFRLDVMNTLLELVFKLVANMAILMVNADMKGDKLHIARSYYEFLICRFIVASLLHGSYEFYWTSQLQDTSEHLTSDRWNSDLFSWPPTTVNEDSLVVPLWAALMLLNTAIWAPSLFVFNLAATFFSFSLNDLMLLWLISLFNGSIGGSSEFQDAPMYPLWSVSEGNITSHQIFPCTKFFV